MRGGTATETRLWVQCREENVGTQGHRPSRATGGAGHRGTTDGGRARPSGTSLPDGAVTG